MDKHLHNTQNTFAFGDDILIVTKGTKQQHMDKLEEVLKILDEAGIRLKFKKCRIPQTKTEWLGYKLSEKGVKLIDEKIQAISDRLRPKPLKELQSLMGALNQMNRFIPNFPEILGTTATTTEQKKTNGNRGMNQKKHSNKLKRK